MSTDDSITIPYSAAPASSSGGSSSGGASAQQRRRTLGKGLGALLGEAAEDYSQLDAPRSTKATPIELLSPGPYQPRTNFTPEALSELAESIREKGIIQPILVRRHPARAGEFQIIAGERRWRAAQIVGLHEVPVIVREMADTEMAEIAIIENVQREDLSLLEEAQAYQRLVTEFHHRQEDIARLVGKSRAYVANTLRLLKLSPEIQTRINDGLITAGHARAMLAAGDDPELLEFIGRPGITVREAEQAVQHKRQETGAKPAKGKLRDANTVALEQEVSRILGLSVSITGRASKGSLTIKYTSLDQLDSLIHKLCGGPVQV